MEFYDYVVVGAGSAGSVVAARLSEHPDHHVLLLEAGTATSPEASRVPSRWQELVGSEHDWGYTTVAQAGTFGTVHRWPRGKLLGGSSAMNGMAFPRGDRSVFDAWERAGATGWSYQRLLPYFMRSERRDGLDPAYHGSEGPLRVAPVATRHPLSEAFHAAVVSVGHPATEDIDGADQYGVGWYGTNIVDGRRQSAADAYLRPHLDRPGLTVVADALALRLLFGGDRCTGVEYRVGSQVRRAHAAREVVVCAGVIGSPQLLMVSGIGPVEHLRQVGVPVVAELPGVGENLHDHLQSGIVYAVDEPIPLGENNHTELTALLRSDESLPGPDIQLYPIHAPYSSAMESPPAHGYTLAAALSLPRSRGRLRLAGPDMATPPLIDPAYLADERDVDTLVAGLHMAQRVGRAEPFTRRRPIQLLPAPDDDWREFVRRSASTQFHPVGTCAIGSVLDPRLRVRGVLGLRVADASVIPSIPSMNPNATVVAIAERAAALLAEDAGAA